MSRHRVIFAVVIALACCGLVTLAELFQPLTYVQANAWLRDAIARHGRTASPNPDLIFLAIDKDSITLDPTLDVGDWFSASGPSDDSKRALELMAQGWPWSREVYALILDRLVGAGGAKAVMFDLFFAEPGPGDEKLREALDRYREHVIIGGNFVVAPDVHFASQTPIRYDLPTSSIISASTAADSRIGFVNFFDEKNVIRGAQYRVGYRNDSGLEEIYLSLAGRAAVDAGHGDDIPADVSEYLIRFTGPPRVGFQPHSIYEIFVPEHWRHNYGSGQKLRNKIVIVGSVGNIGSLQKDEIMTPFGMMPGAELHLNALNALLAHDFLKPLPIPVAIGLILLAGAAAAALCLTIASPWNRLILMLVANGLIFGAAVVLYNTSGILFPTIACAMACDLTVGMEVLSDLGFERLEKLKLKTTLKARENLTNMIVHDLRSPLTIMTGYMGILQQTASANLGETETKFVNAALSGANRMNEMITTLLDVDRLESGQMPLRFAECNLVELIQQTGSRFASVLGQRRIEYAGPTEPIVIDCDGDVIRRVIENLINNSIKYTQPDGRIEISLVPDDACVTICVADDGVGIPVDQRERIFEKFGQIDGGGKHRHSTGLGLTFCRLAVEGHGGRIWVDEPKIGGSTFVFTLPMHHATPSKSATHSTSVIA